MPLVRGGLQGVKANENTLLWRCEKKDTKRTGFRNTDVAFRYFRIAGGTKSKKSEERTTGRKCERINY